MLTMANKAKLQSVNDDVGESDNKFLARVRGDIFEITVK